MKKITKLVLQNLFYLFLVVLFFLWFFNHFYYRPALSAYLKIDENLIGSTFTIAGMVAACEGLKSMPEKEKFKEPFYKESLESDDEKLRELQMNLYTAITIAQPYLDKVTEKKLNKFLKWSQDQQYSIMINNTCPQFNTSFDNLMEWSRNPMSLVPYSFKDYVIYYIKKN